MLIRTVLLGKGLKELEYVNSWSSLSETISGSAIKPSLSTILVGGRPEVTMWSLPAAVAAGVVVALVFVLGAGGSAFRVVCCFCHHKRQVDTKLLLCLGLTAGCWLHVDWFNQLLVWLSWSVISTTWVVMVIVGPKQLVFVSLQVKLSDCAPNFRDFSPLLIIQANNNLTRHLTTWSLTANTSTWCHPQVCLPGNNCLRACVHVW